MCVCIDSGDDEIYHKVCLVNLCRDTWRSDIVSVPLAAAVADFVVAASVLPDMRETSASKRLF